MGSHCTSEVRQRKVRSGDNVSTARARESSCANRSLSVSRRTPSKAHRATNELVITPLNGGSALPTAAIRQKHHPVPEGEGISESHEGRSAESSSGPRKDEKASVLQRRGKKSGDGPTRLRGSDFRTTLACDERKVEDWLVQNSRRASSSSNHEASDAVEILLVSDPKPSHWCGDNNDTHHQGPRPCPHHVHSSDGCCDVRSLKSLSQKGEFDDEATVNGSFASSFSRPTCGAPATPFMLPLFNAKH